MRLSYVPVGADVHGCGRRGSRRLCICACAYVRMSERKIERMGVMGDFHYVGVEGVGSFLSFLRQIN
jgi:hypothetical protein